MSITFEKVLSQKQKSIEDLDSQCFFSSARGGTGIYMVFKSVLLNLRTAAPLVIENYITAPLLVCSTFATLTTRTDRIIWLNTKSVSDFRSDFNNFKYIGYGMNYKVAPYVGNDDNLAPVKRNQIKSTTFFFMDMFSCYELDQEKNYGFSFSLGRLPSSYSSGHYGVPAGIHSNKVTNTSWVDGHVSSEKTANNYVNSHSEYAFGEADNWKVSLK